MIGRYGQYWGCWSRPYGIGELPVITISDGYTGIIICSDDLSSRESKIFDVSRETEVAGAEADGA